MERAEGRRDYYVDLGVDPGASPKDIERAFWHWRCRRVPGVGEELRRAEEAYLTLSDPQRRKDYDRRLGLGSHPAWSHRFPEAADCAFRKCLVYMKRGEDARALRLARRSHRLDPQCALYRSYLALLMARTGLCLKEATALGRIAHEQAPGERRIALNLACLYEMAGLRKRSLGLRKRAGRGFLAALRRFS